MRHSFSYLCKERSRSGVLGRARSRDGRVPAVVAARFVQEISHKTNDKRYEQFHLSQSDRAGFRQGADRPARKTHSRRQTHHDYVRRRQRQAQRRLRAGDPGARGTRGRGVLGYRGEPVGRDAAPRHCAGQGASGGFPAGRGRRFGDRRHETHRRRAALRG